MKKYLYGFFSIGKMNFGDATPFILTHGESIMAEHQQQKTAVAGEVPAALGGFNQLVHLGIGKGEAR